MGWRGWWVDSSTNLYATLSQHAQRSHNVVVAVSLRSAADVIPSRHFWLLDKRTADSSEP